MLHYCNSYFQNLCRSRRTVRYRRLYRSNRACDFYCCPGYIKISNTCRSKSAYSWRFARNIYTCICASHNYMAANFVVYCSHRTNTNTNVCCVYICTITKQTNSNYILDRMMMKNFSFTLNADLCTFV